MIYFDNSASASIDPDVLNSAMPYLTSNFHNPSSLYSKGRDAKKAIEQAREKASKAINCLPEEIFFLPSATEANNWAIRTLYDYTGDVGVLYASSIEHPSIRNSIEHYINYYYDKAYCEIPITKDGILDCCSKPYLSLIEWERSPNNALVTMLVSNEIGTIQPIDIISEDCYKAQTPLFVDMTQGASKLKIDLQKWRGIIMATIAGHKIHSMRGAAILFVRKEFQSELPPCNYGGGQERGFVSGTENTPAIVALGNAMEKFVEHPMDDTQIREMKNYLIKGISEIPNVHFNGDLDYQIPHILNVSFAGIESEALQLLLDSKGIMVSSGSACHSGSLEPSYVLKSIGTEEKYLNSAIRISLSHENTMEECEKFIKILKEEVAKLRSISPVWKEE